MNGSNLVLNWEPMVDVKKSLIDTCAQSHSIIIWGAGIGGAKTADILCENDLYERVKCFVDNSPDKRGMLYKGKSVQSLNDLSDEDKQSLFVISSTAFTVIQRQLIDNGVDESNIMYFQPARLSVDDEGDREFIHSHIDDYETAYNALCDDKSRRIFSNLINYKMSRNATYLVGMVSDIDEENTQYFDRKLISEDLLRDGFIDGGAYDGDTLLSLYRHFPAYMGKVFCFESEPCNYEKLMRYISDVKLKNVSCYNRAIWSEGGVLSIETSEIGGDAGSRVSAKGERQIACCSLDSVIEDDQRIDFIKMDIEGAEKEALMGSKLLIMKYHPTLAICVYHKIEDMYEVWKIIESIAPGVYKFYLRQYRFGDSETVLYAIS